MDIQRWECDGYGCVFVCKLWLILRCQKEQQDMNRSIICAIVHIKSKHDLSIWVIFEAWKWQILVSMNIQIDTWMVSNQMEQSLPITISAFTSHLTCITTYERSTAQWLDDTKANKGRVSALSENTFPCRPTIWHVSRNMSDWHVAFSCAVYSA